jgi:hypothetical protein
MTDLSNDGPYGLASQGLVYSPYCIGMIGWLQSDDTFHGNAERFHGGWIKLPLCIDHNQELPLVHRLSRDHQCKRGDARTCSVSNQLDHAAASVSTVG